MIDDPFGGGTKKGAPKGLPSGKEEPARTELVRSGPGTALDRPAPGTGLAAPRRDKYAMVAQEPRRPLATQLVQWIVALIFDATGSMGSMLGSVQEWMTYIVAQANARLPGIKINFLVGVWRDYGDGSMVTEFFPVSNDPETLTRNITSIRAYGGDGDGAEAMEAALEIVYANSEVKLVCAAGDEPSHNRAELEMDRQGGRKTAIELAEAEGKRGTKDRKTTFTCGVPGHHNEGRMRTEFARIAELTGGQFAMLDGADGKTFADIVVMAIIAKFSKQPRVDLARYQVDNPRMSLAAQGVASRLLLEAKK